MASTLAKFSVAGYATCGYFQRAASLARALAEKFPDRFKADIKSFDSRSKYQEWLVPNRGTFGASSHTSSPFVFQDDTKYVGGCDDFFAFIKSHFKTVKEIQDVVSKL